MSFFFRNWINTNKKELEKKLYFTSENLPFISHIVPKLAQSQIHNFFLGREIHNFFISFKLENNIKELEHN